MCAINPKFKKRFTLDVFTSDPEMSKEKFEQLVSEKALKTEMKLNEDMRLRWHVNEYDKSR